MRRSFRRLKRDLKYIAALAILFVILYIIALASMIPIQFYILIFAIGFICFAIWLTWKIFHKKDKYLDSRGYVVLAKLNALEHRHVAKEILGREFKSNEIVHHINGKKTDNDISNLCIMDSNKHEHFHAWLNWKKTKDHKYPSFSEQKKILEDDYGGILVEKLFKINKFKVQSIPQIENAVLQTKETEKTSANLSDSLLEILKKERNRLASENKIPAFVVFDNNTLQAMSIQLPENDEQLLKIKGVGPAKLQTYGYNFISIIKKYKNRINEKS